MSESFERARRSWLITFGDVITLLLTFFIMMIVLHKGEVSKLQAWADNKVSSTYQQLNDAVEKDQLEVISLKRSAQGILVSINHSNAFKSGDYVPSDQLRSELELIGGLLKEASLFNVAQDQDARRVINLAKQAGLQWLTEVNIEGHTDSDRVDPHSRLRNNWFLSTMRAQEVMQLLFVSSGLPAEYFSVDGYGEFQPIASNDSAEDKAKNRRIDVLISAGFRKTL